MERALLTYPDCTAEPTHPPSPTHALPLCSAQRALSTGNYSKIQKARSADGRSNGQRYACEKGVGG